MGGNEVQITFQCPYHGRHRVRSSSSTDLRRLEANAPSRNLIRSMSHLLDTETHHIRVTGSDYAGLYKEAFLYRPLAEWSVVTGHAAQRTPHILYSPLVLDWSDAKLTKSLYLQGDSYESMKLFGVYGLVGYCKMGKGTDVDNSVRLHALWLEVGKWFEDPKMLFRAYLDSFSPALNSLLPIPGGSVGTEPGS